MNKTPKLRFKEFSGEWETTKIGSVFDLSSGSTPSKSNKSYYNGDNCWVTSGELKSKYINTTLDKITKKALDETNLSIYPPGTFVIAIYGLEASGTRGSCSILQVHSTISQACMAFTSKGNISNEFLYYWYNKYGEEIGIKYAQGTKQQNLSSDLVGNIKITAPSMEEQEKIASFFSLIDKKISLQSEKVEMFKEYKNGMIQKIFSGELRFKDDSGRDYPEWEENNIGKLIKIKSERNKNNEIALVLSVSNTKGFIRQADQFEDRVVASSDISNYKIVENGDFAFNPARINVGSIARLKLYNKGVISPMYICFKTLELLDDDYLEYFLMTSSFDIQMKKKLEGSVRQTLSAEALGQIIIKLPCLSEQKKIGLFLNTINDKLKKEEEKLDSLNEYKKGLLQQMFV